jgi:hypothetical protein
MYNDIVTSPYAFIMYRGINTQLLTVEFAVELGSGFLWEKAAVLRL